MRVQQITGGQGSHRVRRLSQLSLVAVGALVAAACGSTSSSTTANSSSSSSVSNPGVPSSLTLSSYTPDIASTMSLLKPLTTYATKGSTSLLVGVVLPDTTSSTRWVQNDAPYLTDAFADAGFTSAQFNVQNAQGSDPTQIDDATADINLGAKVLVVCPLDGPTGVAIAALAAAHNVVLIDYDRAIFPSSGKTYYVSFDNEKVGELIGTGFLSCLTSEKVSSAKVFVLNGGEDTDPNAISFASGYNKVVWGQAAKSVTAPATSTAGGATLVGENFAPGWNNTQGGTIFQQEYTANKQINASIEANDGLASAVITDLQTDGVTAGTFPTTGQDATVQGMAYILEGWQCGSVYKPIYLEAQDAVVMATILLSGNKIPTAILNGTTVDPASSSISEPASLLTPTWVTKANMEATVVKDAFDTASAICAIAGAALCTTDGIS
jgi:D-xylose transport system substrate-binding protein